MDSPISLLSRVPRGMRPGDRPALRSKWHAGRLDAKAAYVEEFGPLA